MSTRPAMDVLHAWLADDPLPEGWEFDVDEAPEGGQPNGRGEIEPSDSREWFTPEAETHHRARLVITVTGPWEDGPTEFGARMRQARIDERERQRIRDEDRILAEARAITERRATL